HFRGSAAAVRAERHFPQGNLRDRSRDRPEGFEVRPSGHARSRAADQRNRDGEQGGRSASRARGDDLRRPPRVLQEEAHVRPTSWAACKQGGKQTMVMGDVVLGEDQVNPVMGVALDNGLEVTALHNHFLWESPIVMFMHIGGMGDEAQVASAVGKVFAKIKETSGAPAEMKTADIDPEKTSFDPTKLDA